MAKPKRKTYLRHGRPYEPTEGGKLCGHPRRSRPGRFCRRPAGFNTQHPGQGRCHLHQGVNQGVGRKGRKPADRRDVFVHPYDTIVHNSLTDKWRQLSESEYNVLDLIPEANLLRVLIVDFINRYEDYAQALIRWHTGKTATKPRRVLDIADAYRMVGELGKLIERIHKMRQEGAISLETFRRVVEAMGIVVTKHVPDAETLGHIEREWQDIAIDARRPDRLAQEGEDEDEDDEEEWES